MSNSNETSELAVELCFLNYRKVRSFSQSAKDEHHLILDDEDDADQSFTEPDSPRSPADTSVPNLAADTRIRFNLTKSMLP